MNFNYKTKGTCSSEISFNLENGIVKDVVFRGGCNGNLKAISKLVEGQEASRVIELLKGNTCGPRDTSCADQLTKALEAALVAQNA
ncbi:MAG: TIGR03905 family TSCPD domain-containing protein [Clostridia bacterium]|nr:TIGR03905 family TSCPD domain-containing protein [Clostridia bacterium]